MASALFTKAIVERAINLIRAGVTEDFIKQGKDRVVAYVVVLNPTLPFQFQYLRSGPSETRVDARLPILWEGAIGEQDRSKWPRKYDQFARAKALVSWRTGLPSHVVQRDYPHMYEGGDFKYGGSTIVNGIIVATSGLDWNHDLAVSGMVASACHALTIGAFEKEFAGPDFYIRGEEQPKTA